MVVGKVDSASVDTSVAVPSPSSSKPAVTKPGQPRKEQSKSLNASAPSFNPPVRGRAPPRAPSVSSPRVRPPSVASTVSARSNQQQQQQRVPRPAPEPRGYIPAEVKTTRKSEADVDARILAARIKAEDARKKYEAAEAERIAYEKQVQEEQTAAVEKAEKDRKQQEEMSAYREAARQRKLKAMTESSIDTESNGNGGGGFAKEE